MTAGPVPVLTAVTGSWETPLVTGLEGAGGQVRVVRRCVDLADLLAAAATGTARAAILSADLQRLDREAVAALTAAGMGVVGLADPADPDAAGRLTALGVHRVLPADAPPAAVAAAVAVGVRERAEAAPSGTGRRSGTGDPGDALPAVPGGPPGPEPESPPARGRIVAVWGPVGAPGRTTVAVTLAAEIAAAGRRTLLVDADTYGASVAQALGLLDESAGLAAAARAANQGALDVARLSALAPAVGDRLQVLTGLPQPRRWPELRGSALEVVWDRARRLAEWTVVDCGFGLEADEELSFDTAAPRRNASTLSAVEAADLVLVVGGCEPIGLQRLVRGLQELGEVRPPGRDRRVVVTRVRSGSVGSPAERRVTEALARYAGVADPVLVPDDRAGCDAAMLAGRSLTEQVPASPARAAIAGLAAGLLADGAAGRRPGRPSSLLRRGA